MTKSITIKEVKTIKNGVGKRGVWTLYSVIAEDGSRYSTFEGKYQGMIGQTITAQVESKPSDKINPNTNQPYVNMSIVEAPRTAKIDLGKEIADIKKRLDNLENYTGFNDMLLTPTKKVNMPVDFEVDNRGIPF